MTDCPCCSNTMLRHIGHHQVYWFCRHCWQEMPVFDVNQRNSSPLTALMAEVGLKKPHSLLRIS